jgi:hypothetical protein
MVRAHVEQGQASASSSSGGLDQHFVTVFGEVNRSLGLQLAPAKDASGAGDRGVVIVIVDLNGAKKGLSGDAVIFEVSGKIVFRPGEVKGDIAAAKHDGKKAVLMKIKTANGEHFVSFAFPKVKNRNGRAKNTARPKNLRDADEGLAHATCILACQPTQRRIVSEEMAMPSLL